MLKYYLSQIDTISRKISLSISKTDCIFLYGELGSGKNRSKGARNALLRNFAASLILDGKIETTFAKAKVINSYVDSIASRAKKSNDRNNIDVFCKNYC